MPCGLEMFKLFFDLTMFNLSLPKPKLYSKFELASFNDCKNKYGGSRFFGMLP